MGQLERIPAAANDGGERRHKALRLEGMESIFNLSVLTPAMKEALRRSKNSVSRDFLYELTYNFIGLSLFIFLCIGLIRNRSLKREK